MASGAIVPLCGIWKPVAIDILLFHSTLDPWIFYSLYSFFVLLAIALIHQSRSDLRAITPILNVVAVVMIAWPTFQIVKGVIDARHAPDHVLADVLETPQDQPDTMKRPNVVLLILDEYTRADMLDKYFGFDNQEFVHALEERGFVVGRESRSNYNATRLSIPSMLNIDYLFEDKDSLGEVDYHEVMDNNYVLRFFDAMGYETYAFTTGFEATEPGPLVDHILPEESTLVSKIDFLSLLLELTPANEILAFLKVDFVHKLWRDNMLYMLHNLHRPIEEARNRPVYVRAHVIAPHPPFVFLADGGPRSPNVPFSLMAVRGAEQDQLMIEQTKGLNKHVLRAVDNVLAASKEPPIVIITSDHGTVLANRMAGRSHEILLAAYLPGEGHHVPRSAIDSMHLVNLFRFVFNTYFKTEFPMLEYEAPIEVME